MQTSKSSIGPENILSFAADWWRNWRSQRNALGELNGCGEDEAAHIARDVGVAPAELRILAAKWPDASDLLSRRIDDIGLKEQQIEATEPQALRDLQRVCTQCEDRARCKRDLDRRKTGGAWRDYCPNIATLDALRTEERDRRLLRRRPNWRSF
jgi:uncharacterized protein YjiS (DUF1127 family)